MISDIIAFALTHPFLSGMAIGGAGFGGAFGIIGWCIGHDHATRKFTSWMRPKKVEEAHGYVPTLPPVRERRPIATTPGRYV